MAQLKTRFVIFLIFFKFSFGLGSKTLESILSSSSLSSSSSSSSSTSAIPNIASHLGESVLLPCGTNEHELLRQLESNVPSMPVLVNWFKHYSYTRRSDKPIYAKYLANNIDYAPHISAEYENRLQIVDKINLNISNLKAVDEALYECRLVLFDKAYADGQTGSLLYLQVYVAPEFEYPNEEIVYFKPNMPIRLYCYAKGKPAPVISWYRNGAKLDANTSVLQETSSFLDDSVDIFEYKCRAENVVGQIEHTVRAIRSGSLFFAEPLRNLTISEGTILNWPCLAQSNAEITYKWFKDSVAVQLGLHKWADRGALFQDGMLYLLEAFRNDSGVYECHAYTANKRIETSAYLNVLYGPEISEFPSPHLALESSHSVVLDCVVKSNPSVTALEWFKDKYLLSNTNKYRILPNNSLLIRNVQKADKGNYYCACNNTIKKAVSAVIKLDVVEQRRLDIVNLHANSAQLFKLPCPALSNQTELINQLDLNEVKWFKLNSRMAPGRFSLDSDASLLIQSARSSDAGVYLCRPSEHLLAKIGKVNSDEKSHTEKGIKLTVTSIGSSEISSEKSSDNLKSLHSTETSQASAGLPPSPEKVRVNQTLNGVLVAWTYPEHTPVKIESFQVYFRQYIEKLNYPSIGAKTIHEWRSSETIPAAQTSYLIEPSLLVEDTLYELQIVSFSLFSKSPPSSPVKFKFIPKFPKILSRPVIHSFQSGTTQSPLPFADSLINMSQLDLILVGIFLVLILVLAVFLAACVVYKRARKLSSNKKRGSKRSIDDWGFQTSAATATFLSSSSSSDKSFNIFKQYKTQRSSALECDLKRADLPPSHNKKSRVEKYETDAVNRATNLKIKNLEIISDTRSSSNDSSNTGSHSNATDNNRVMSSEYLNCAHSTCPSSGTEATQSENAQLINNSSTSSGITSDESEASFKSETIVAVNTIKYNAKTNILHEKKELRCSNAFRVLSDSGKESSASSGNCYLNWTPCESSAYSSTSIMPKFEAESPMLPFPAINEQDSSNKLIQQLNSSSSLTLVSKMPTTSCCYIDSNEPAVKLDDDESEKAIASGLLSSSSSGCSSLENQYYTKIPSADKHVIKLKRVSRNSSSNEEKMRKKPALLFNTERKNIKFIETLNGGKKQSDISPAKFLSSKNNYQNFSTYKPLVKNNDANRNCLNSTNNNISNSCSNKNLMNNCNNSNNNQTFNFRASRIDYV